MTPRLVYCLHCQAISAETAVLRATRSGGTCSESRQSCSRTRYSLFLNVIGQTVSVTSNANVVVDREELDLEQQLAGLPRMLRLSTVIHMDLFWSCTRFSIEQCLSEARECLAQTGRELQSNLEGALGDDTLSTSLHVLSGERCMRVEQLPYLQSAPLQADSCRSLHSNSRQQTSCCHR